MTNHSHLVLAALLTSACSGATTASDDVTSAADDVASTSEPSVCGDQIRAGAEACDGPDLAGATCTSIGGFVGGTLACTADCAAFDTSMCAADPSGPVVRLNEVTSADLVDGPYAPAGDAIEIVNVGMAPADLSGYRISDDPTLPSDKSFAFAEGTTLAPGAFLVLRKRDEATGQGDYPFGISSTESETITLVGAANDVVDAVTFLGSDATVSWCRIPDGDGAWRGCARSFGSANEIADGDTGGDETTSNAGATTGADDTGSTVAIVVVNELSSSGADAIELFNAGDAAIDLAGWVLTDDLTSPDDAYDPAADDEALVFASGTVLDAGAWMVIEHGQAPGHPFGLAGAGDSVALLLPDLTLVDFVAYGDGEAADSYCRLPDGPGGAWQADCTPSFGASND